MDNCRQRDTGQRNPEKGTGQHTDVYLQIYVTFWEWAYGLQKVPKRALRMWFTENAKMEALRQFQEGKHQGMYY